MELDVLPSINALFMNGDLTVQGLVTALAQSDSYRRLFLETNSPYRFVELNFKHLLGRAPRDQAEVMEHVKRMAEEGLEAEIASYTYSDEYLQTFGVDQVPYLRKQTSQQGGSTQLHRANGQVSPVSMEDQSQACSPVSEPQNPQTSLDAKVLALANRSPSFGTHVANWEPTGA